MSEFVFKLPDLGEGTVEAEIVEWHVAIGDVVEEGDTIADVMTDKANVELPAPVSGTILRLAGEPGDIVAVGAELIAIATGDSAVVASQAETAQVEPEPVVEATPEQAPQPEQAPEPETVAEAPADLAPTPVRASGARVLASPSLRKRAAEAGIELADIPGTGPGGRILRRDFDAFTAGGAPTPQQAASAPAPSRAGDVVTEVKIIGLRRRIAAKMSQSAQEIPHFAYVEEVDITELEALRRHLNAKKDAGLTLLPFLGLALARVLVDFPQCNAIYDPEAGVLRQHEQMHLGIAAQTDDGLKVPVVHRACCLSIWELADEIRKVTEAARDGSASVAQLSGSTITISSLGKLGGIASTPIINYPEVAIIGVNRATERPVVIEGRVEVRTMMNISSSFDHRFIDGFDAASLIQAIKERLEHPALLWVD